jgi:hypothetical protein
MKKKQYLWLGGSLMFAASALQAADVNVTADITTNTTWTAANAYILDKSIFVKNGATLTIEPGTTILGTKNVANNTYGSLIITRNGTIMAEGTAEAPIVMTAKADRDAELTADTADDLDPETDGGLYGGLIILGSAPINYYTGPTTNANEFSIEGFPAGSSTDILYGGNDVADNSGVVKYMSLRFGGYVYATNKEINGLTMGGVGSGTTVENVEIVGNTDDGMEIFGGTVNTKRIAVAFCQDDSFDLDEGHQGFHQFWFAIQNSTGTLGDRGGEWDGGNGSDSVRTGTPHTTATIYNATFIGDSGTSGGGNTGIYMDDYFAGKLHNSVLHQFSGATIVNSGDGVGNGVSPQPSAAVFSNNTWGTFGLSTGLVIGAAGSPTGTGNSAVGTDPMLRGISRTANFGLDPRPKAASPLRNSTLSAAPVGAPVGFFEATTYRGAFGDTNWLDGWSYLSQQGYLGVVQTDVNVTADITTNTTWSEENAYILDKSIFVKNGATLTIEPGTTILGTKNVANNTYGSLIITRNGTIMAEGTAEAPIVMTAKADRDAELTADTADDLDPETDGGLYGGLIILGSAPINYYTGPTTNANEFSIEGFPAGSSTDILYGGNDVADNSGVVKYMSLRFGGYVYATNKEINGLTMGGVGSGTTVENVEIVGNTDDGMEIFGGTVNTKRIAVAFCQDDSFDLDEGHQGFHQFWFAIQNSTGTLGDRGGEWDGGNGSDSVRTGTPHTTATIYNATFIGDSGTSGGGNTGIYMDDYFAGKLHNSVLHQFSGATIVNSGDGVGNGVSPQPSAAVFSNNTWGTFGLSTGLVIGAAGSPTGTGNSAVGTDPMLVGISRTANGGLDPRPNLASPLRNSTLSAAPAGAPVGFFETTTYRGAFGDTNWLNGWTYLSQNGYLSGYPDAGSSTGAVTVADADSDGISDAVETANTGLGFNPAVSDATTVLGTLKTTAQFTANYTAGQTSVTADPNAFSLYNTADILDLRTVGQTTVQKVGNTAILSVPVQKSNTLGGWVPAGNMTLGVDVTSSPTKEFYRLSVEGAQ